ncbi:MAG: hypothetical protein DRH10_00690 [Deltaproteobacteria bacterium]|nr:MAG: hypothetical protein DRH10_00690 [Deltaproteobacteria bacterium]RLC88360.1 MAG: hypothetical protein DRJ03_02905 [Chloroflexota bacterium]
MADQLPPETWEKTSWDSLKHKFKSLCALKATVTGISLLSPEHQAQYVAGTIDDLLGTIIEDAYIEVDWEPRPDLPSELIAYERVDQSIYDCGLFHTAHRADGDPLIHGFWNNPWMFLRVGDVVMVLYDKNQKGPNNTTIPIENRLLLAGHSNYDGLDGKDNDFTIPAQCGAEGFFLVFNTEKILTVRNGYVRMFELTDTAPEVFADPAPINYYSIVTNEEYNSHLQDYNQGFLASFMSYVQVTKNFSVYSVFPKCGYIERYPRDWGKKSLTENHKQLFHKEGTFIINSVEREAPPIYNKYQNFYMPAGEWNKETKFAHYILDTELPAPNAGKNEHIILTPSFTGEDVSGFTLSKIFEKIHNTEKTATGTVTRTQSDDICNGSGGRTIDDTATMSDGRSTLSSESLIATNGTARLDAISSDVINFAQTKSEHTEWVWSNPDCTGGYSWETEVTINSSGNTLRETTYNYTTNDGQVIEIGKTLSVLTGTSNFEQQYDSGANNNFEETRSIDYNETALVFIVIDLAKDFLMWVEHSCSGDETYNHIFGGGGTGLTGSDMEVTSVLKILHHGEIITVENFSETIPHEDFGMAIEWGAKFPTLFGDSWGSRVDAAPVGTTNINESEINSTFYIVTPELKVDDFLSYYNLWIPGEETRLRIFRSRMNPCDYLGLFTVPLGVDKISKKIVAESTDGRLILTSAWKLENVLEEWNIIVADGKLITKEFDSDTFEYEAL